MQYGVTFPQTEIGTDPGAVVAYAQAAEELGFDFIQAFDHVLGADTRVRPDWQGFYKHTDQFLEPLVLFGFLAGLTKTIQFETGILILPQRQTALVAKQTAVVDVLSKGRLRVGVGTGWNAVEYEALGKDFHNRGKREAEQISLLRALWTQEVVTFKGKYETVTAAGLNPLPVQRPIPIWLGGSAEPVLKRIGEMGDGWILTRYVAGAAAEAAFEKVRGYARAVGRDPKTIGFQGRVQLAKSSPGACAEASHAWGKSGATHVTINTMDAGLKGVQGHIEAIRKYREALGK